MENPEKETVPTIAHDNRSSVEMSINAKGQVAGKGKIYSDAEVDAILKKIKEKQVKEE